MGNVIGVINHVCIVMGLHSSSVCNVLIIISCIEDNALMFVLLLLIQPFQLLGNVKIAHGDALHAYHPLNVLSVLMGSIYPMPNVQMYAPLAHITHGLILPVLHVLISTVQHAHQQLVINANPIIHYTITHVQLYAHHLLIHSTISMGSHVAHAQSNVSIVHRHTIAYHASQG